MGLRQFVIDAWSWLNYKPGMAEVGRPGSRVFPGPAGSWLPPGEWRRLAAYRVLASYDNNQAGQLAAVSGDENVLDRRELGDAANLVDTALGYLLGTGQQVAVVGGENADEEAPEPGVVEAAVVQERLRGWAEKELLTLRVQQAERAAVLLGDGVYTLVWSPESGGRRCGCTTWGSSSHSGTTTRTRTFPRGCTSPGTCRPTTRLG
ncbi:hypothetical protein ABZX85_47155 [Streptomyces sp. NPDC004539]|uniref:hypothetical protein n=1 Tax=Streptomyces sp. NPDC004539 TaxID=3154280 RepID=UPI0033BA68AD